MPGRIRPVPLKFHDDPPNVVPMITARSLAIVVDRMTRVLRALETVSERFLLVAAVQDGCPPAEAEAIVGYLVSRGLVFRRGTTLELTTEGRRMALDVRQWRETHVNSPVAAVTWR